ncbi:UDP-N-acetylglucosamine 2-epimerase [Pseudonocardia sp.]|uniref:UDP-N-acetylglucosamine 2-epimerase n=1 Tax=Pseudonocardia sp. TaxID=60912 RepID=UPI003D120D95
MTEYDPVRGSLPVPEHDDDVLLIAGCRAEVARLAPVATAFAIANRIHPLTVATGDNPMAVHEAFEDLGTPADVTVLLTRPPGVDPAAIVATLTPRLDELLVDLDPSAIMVHGGGMTALVAAQVAFWRQIPVVHLQAGVASDDLLCPFPQEANRRVIGQLASLFLTTGGAALGSPIGPNTIPVGDTMTSNPPSEDMRFAPVLRRVREGASRLVTVALDRTDSLGVLASLPELLDREPAVEVVLFGELGAHGAAHSLALHERAVVARDVPFPELIGLLAASTVIVSDDLETVADAPGFGTPAVFVDGNRVAELGDSIRSIGSPSVLATVRQLLAGPDEPTEPVDGLAAARAEQAVAWMFGLADTPILGADIDLPAPREPLEEPLEYPRGHDVRPDA